MRSLPLDPSSAFEPGQVVSHADRFDPIDPLPLIVRSIDEAARHDLAHRAGCLHELQQSLLSLCDSGAVARKALGKGGRVENAEVTGDQV